MGCKWFIDNLQDNNPYVSMTSENGKAGLGRHDTDISNQ